MKKIVLTLALLAATVTGAHAQAAAASAPSPARRAAALEMVDAANMGGLMDQSINTMLQAQIQQNPQLAPLEDVMRAFFAKYMSWQVLREQYADLYATSFTEQELKQLTAFYRSPVGQKLGRVSPDLMTRASALGQQAVQAHLPELQQAIMERMQQGTAAPSRP
jgi:hypothetical protein